MSMAAAPPAALPSIERYVYYRVRAAHAVAAFVAVTSLHAQLRREDPALALRLLRRPEAPDGVQTWMEVHARPGGVTDAQGDTIERRAAVALAGLLDGPRHVERFMPLDGPVDR